MPTWMKSTDRLETEKKQSKVFQFSTLFCWRGCWGYITLLTNNFGVEMQVVDALVPLAEMFQYVSTLRGMTKGRASYTMQLAKFDVVPQHIQNQLAAKEQVAA